MNDGDKERFFDAMESARAMYQTDNADAFASYWDVLSPRMSVEQLELAIREHMADTTAGRFSPKPAFPRPIDLIAQVNRMGPKHLPADSAWAIALASMDETASVVWTAEIEAARNRAMPIWESGDKVGARLAFRACYERLKQTGPPKWKFSAGHDPAGRVEAVERALTHGLLDDKTARRLLPDLSTQEAAGNVLMFPEAGPVGDSLTALRKLRASLKGGRARRKVGGVDLEGGK